MLVIRSVVAALLLSVAFNAQALVDDDYLAGGGSGAGGTVGSSGPFGLGVGSLDGHISGLSLKLFVGDTSALQWLIGSAWGGGFALSMDFIQEIRNFLNHEVLAINGYLGGGAFLVAYDSDIFSRFGAAFIMGVSLRFQDVPIELAFELRPSYVSWDYWYRRAAGFTFMGGGAIRFYF